MYALEMDYAEATVRLIRKKELIGEIQKIEEEI